MTHTPGPWIIETEPDCDDDTGAPCGEYLIASPYSTVGYINLANPDNARLIAAAPDMLVALKKVSDLLDVGCSVEPSSVLHRSFKDLIAKAEGSL